jgi:hypothetical protein
MPWVLQFVHYTFVCRRHLWGQRIQLKIHVLGMIFLLFICIFFHRYKFDPQAKFNFEVSNHVLPIHFNFVDDPIMQNFQLSIFGVL